MGFRHVLAEMSAGLQVLEVREMRDDPERAYLETAALLDRHPDLVAIYIVGVGNTGVAQALRERGRGRLVIFVGHEVTDGTRELLLDGTLDALIDQNPRVEAREALFSHRIRGLPYNFHSPRLQVIFRENIPRPIDDRRSRLDVARKTRAGSKISGAGSRPSGAPRLASSSAALG